MYNLHGHAHVEYNYITKYVQYVFCCPCVFTVDKPMYIIRGSIYNGFAHVKYTYNIYRLAHTDVNHTHIIRGHADAFCMVMPNVDMPMSYIRIIYIGLAILFLGVLMYYISLIIYVCMPTVSIPM